MNISFKLRRILFSLTFLQILLSLFAVGAWSQTSSLNEQYQTLIEKSETYDKYKVISKTKLDQLWNNVLTELNAQQQAITELKVAQAEANVKQDSLVARINSLSRLLNESAARNESIPVLGIDISHNVYHAMVWSIIGLLIIGMIYFALRFKMNITTVDQLLLEKEALLSEYEDHKFNAHQKMLKTKRELQTALNQLEERQVRSA